MTHNAKKKKKKKQTYQEFHQLSIKGTNITMTDAEVFGDSMKKKPPNTVCIGLHNIQLMPKNSRHYKSRQLINHISNAELDVLLMNEIRLNWKKVSADNQWVESVE